MAIEITHATEAVGTEAGNGEIAKVEWNEAHKILMATARLIGRVTSGAGSAEEIAIYNGLLMDANGLGIDKATAANIRSRASSKVLTADNIASAKAPVALSYASTLAVDFTAGFYRTCTLTGSPTLGNPTNAEPGDWIVIKFIGDSATERSISLGSEFGTEPPEDTATSTQGLGCAIFCAAAGEFHAFWWVFEP